MNYYRNKLKALEYIKRTKGFDGRELIAALSFHLKPGDHVLEIGMGPGKDLDLLKNKYKVTGSDISEGFLELYREKYPDADLLQLDAETLKTDQQFNAVYSNKVLHQLSREGLKRSFRHQYDLLFPAGIACHSFWYGDKEIEAKGMKFQYYTEDTIQPFVKDLFDVVFWQKYMEVDTDDSILIILKKRSV